MFQVVRHVEFSLVYEQRQNSIDTWATNQNAGSISACCEWCIMAKDERYFKDTCSCNRARLHEFSTRDYLNNVFRAPRKRDCLGDIN